MRLTIKMTQRTSEVRSPFLWSQIQQFAQAQNYSSSATSVLYDLAEYRFFHRGLKLADVIALAAKDLPRRFV